MIVETPLLPTFQTRKQGESFRIGITWENHLATSETLSEAESEMERMPPDGETILGDTTIDDETTIIEFAIPEDAVTGRYHIRHVVTTSAENIYEECFSIEVEAC